MEDSLRSSPGLAPLRLLGLDVGQKRIGLAITDDRNRVVFPRGNLERKNKNQTIVDLKKFCEEEKVSKIICGLPLDEQERERRGTRAIRAFGELIEKELHIPVEFIDEAFSTDEAIAKMPKYVKKFKDELAAAIILERYLQISPS